MLTEEQQRFYADNGYLHIRGLLTPEEAASYRSECHALSQRLSALRDIDSTWGSAATAAMGKKTSLLHCHDVQFQSAAFTRLLVDERLTAAATGILGPNVQMHHTKMFIKPPDKGAPFPMHQDAPFFPHERHSMIAVILHFDDAPLEKGCLRVVPGSHKLGMLPHDPAGSWHLPPDAYPVLEAVPVEAKAGDAIFFSYLTIHGSGLNESSEARTTLLIQMRDPADPPSFRAHESNGQGMMLAGIDPGCAAPLARARVQAADGRMTEAAHGEVGASPSVPMGMGRPSPPPATGGVKR